MDREALRRLELVNQLRLTDEEKENVLSFFARREEEMALLCGVDTADVERMVHVMPLSTVVREDEVVKRFTRDALQAAAPETDEGYWCVPRVVE